MSLVDLSQRYEKTPRYFSYRYCAITKGSSELNLWELATGKSPRLSEMGVSGYQIEMLKTTNLFGCAVTAWFITWPLFASAQTRAITGDAEAGRALALTACTGCHVVAPTQPFKPVYVGSPHPPDFKDIANNNWTAESLQHHLESLPAVPQKPGMPNPNLTSKELRDVAAFIFTLRESAVAPGR